jgi:hypothetical protein
MSNPTTVQQAYAVLSDQDKLAVAAAISQLASPSSEVQVLTLDLSVAQDINNPLQIGTARTIFVAATTGDPNGTAQIQFRPNSRMQSQAPIPLGKKDSYVGVIPWGQGFLHWAAQPGVKVTVLLLTHGAFYSGSQINQITGTMSVSEGTTGPSSSAAVSLTTTVAAQILTADGTRVVTTIENQGQVPIYLGDANVTGIAGAKPGIRLQPGATYDWKNTGALYGALDAANAGVQVAILNLK